MGILGKRGRATAEVGRILSGEIVSRIRELLIEFHEIPWFELPTIYQYKYGHILDFGDLGFDRGLVDFLRQLDYFIDCLPTEYGYSCVMKPGNGYIERPIKLETGTLVNGKLNISAILKNAEKNGRNYRSFLGLVRERQINRLNNYLFDPDNILWFDKYQKLLNDMHKVVLVPSQLDEAYDYDLFATRIQVARVHKALLQFPNGVDLCEIGNIVALNKILFRSKSICELVDKCPELFYRVEPEDCPERPIVFDGHTTTCEDLKGAYIGLDPAIKNQGGPLFIAWKSIKSGLYQKTLILLRKAGVEGLKLGTWRMSILRNFGQSNDQFLDDLMDQLVPLQLLLALASLDLVEIRSHETCKNDLRLHFPSKKVNFIELYDRMAYTAKRIVET